jgi:two-component system response regulator QseB
VNDVVNAVTNRGHDPQWIAADGAVSRAAGTRPPRLLLVEDDPELTDLLVRLLSDESYEVEVASDAQRGLHLGLTHTYDVIVMDRRLPAGDGLDLLIMLRAKGMVTPTLLLSALGHPSDRVAGLDAGAEDYLAKPFDVDELLARLRALRRRHLDQARRLPVPGGLLDLDTRQVALPDRPGLRLSARECALLATLAGRPRKVFSRDELRRIAFDDAGVEIVDTYVHYLRRKLGHDVVDTVRGYGYQLGTPR